MDGLQALDKSLEIWTAKSKTPDFDGSRFGEDDYPLCDLYHQEPGTRPFYRCPVAEATGAAWCDATPLHTVKWFHHIWSRKPNSRFRRALYRFQARRMIGALQSAKRISLRRQASKPVGRL